MLSVVAAGSQRIRATPRLALQVSALAADSSLGFTARCGNARRCRITSEFGYASRRRMRSPTLSICFDSDPRSAANRRGRCGRHFRMALSLKRPRRNLERLAA